MPMVAMFIVFDFVIYNPLHAEARKNLAYLDIVSAHYARLDLASQGTLHDSMVAEFTSIARTYVNESSAARDNRANNAAMGNDLDEVLIPTYSSEPVQRLLQNPAPPVLSDELGQGGANLVRQIREFLLITEATARIALVPRDFRVQSNYC